MRVPDLEDVPLIWRLALAVVVVVTAATIIFFSMLAAEAQQGPPPVDMPQLYAGIPLDATLLRLDRRALDEAYHAQVMLLFAIWLKQQAGDPTQITNGLKIARRAYNQAATQIAKREQQLLEQDLREQERRSR